MEWVGGITHSSPFLQTLKLSYPPNLGGIWRNELDLMNFFTETPNALIYSSFYFKIEV